jgi:hypothetical protein
MEDKKRSPSEEDNDEEGRRSSRRKKAKVRPEYPQFVMIFCPGSMQIVRLLVLASCLHTFFCIFPFLNIQTVGKNIYTIA